MREVLIRHRYRPVPTRMPSEPVARRRATEALERVNGVLGEPLPTDQGADYETAWEELLRLDAALTEIAPDGAWLSTATSPHEATEPRALGAAPGATPVDGALTWGPGSESIQHFGHAAPDFMPYWASPAFIARAGRPVLSAGFYTEDGHLDARDAAAQVADTDGRFFLKPTKSKALPACAATLVPDKWEGRGMEFDSESWDWAPTRLEGLPDTVLIQSVVPMRYEYRLFVVGHTPVAGAGPLEDCTPFDSRGMVFDDRVQEVCGRSGATVQTQIVDDLVAFGREFTAAFAAEGGHEQFQDRTGQDGCYTLDVALGPDGPLVVELNDLGSSGLYAVEPRFIAAAYQQLRTLEVGSIRLSTPGPRR